jgi:hypothetical protein
MGRQHQPRPQPRRRVLELEPAAMEPCHRDDEAEAEPAAGRAAAGLETIEAPHDLVALALGDARPVVLDDQLDVALARRRAHADMATRPRVLDRVVDEVRQRLRHQRAIARAGRGREPGLEREAALLGERLVELRDVGGERRGVDRREGRAAMAGLDLGDAQQRLEDAHDLVELLQRRLGRGAEAHRRVRIAQRGLQPAAQPRQRRAQVVRDRVGDLAHAVHQLRDAVEHQVDVAGEPVELVARPGQLHPRREVAEHDAVCDAGDAGQPAREQVAREETHEDRQRHRHRDRPGERVGDDLAHVEPHLVVAADIEDMRLAHRQAQHPCRRVDGAAEDLEVEPGRARLGGRALEVARDDAARLVDQRQDLVVVGLVGQPRLDRAGERRDAAAAEALEQRVGAGDHGLLGLAHEIALGRPVDVAREQQRRAREERGVADREAQDRGAQHGRARQGSARRL